MTDAERFREGRRTIWQLERVEVMDSAGAGKRVFAVPGLFIP